MRYTLLPDCQIPNLADFYEKYLTRHPGTFVEVGACDGRAISNTWCLAEAGWTGLYIEPHPMSAAQCIENHKNHPNIKVANVGILDSSGTADLYDIGDCSTTVWDKNAIAWGGQPDKKIKIPVFTLDELLNQYSWEPGFDLLVIDVEQAELAVLSGCSLRYWLPTMAIIETHEFDPALERNWKAEPIIRHMASHGYEKVYSDAINSIFVKMV